MSGHDTQVLGSGDDDPTVVTDGRADDASAPDDDGDDAARAHALAPGSGTARAAVNLLPPEVVRERVHRRRAAASGGVLAVWVLVLAVVYALQLGDVAQARAEREEAAEATEAVAEAVAELAPFRTLADTLTVREALVAAATADELSWARVLGDLALALDRSASLLELQAVSVPAAAETVSTDGATLAVDEHVAEIVLSGYTVDRYAPGVEQVLEQLSAVDGFFGSSLAVASEEERGATEVTLFDGRVLVDASARARRFLDGIPPEEVR